MKKLLVLMIGLTILSSCKKEPVNYEIITITWDGLGRPYERITTIGKPLSNDETHYSVRCTPSQWVKYVNNYNSINNIHFNISDINYNIIDSFTIKVNGDTTIIINGF